MAVPILEFDSGRPCICRRTTSGVCRVLAMEPLLAYSEGGVKSWYAANQ